MKTFTRALTMTSLLVAASLLGTSAYATEGMFANGTGARNKALAGSGVADQKDATAIAVNPAGLVNSDTQLSGSASLFSPWRGFSWPAAGLKEESNSNYFLVPNLAYNVRLDANTAIGLSLYGNGGMNTDYGEFFNAGCPAGQTGLACRGTAGIDLQQMFMSVGLAKRYGDISVGVAPIIALQLFEADGLATPFGPVAEKLDTAAGIAARAGVEWSIQPNLRLGLAAATPTWMQSFHHYPDLFGAGERQGELRLPATVQAGLAFDLMPAVTLMADYKRIFYSDVEAIGSSAAAGGFGWDDVNVYKLGLEWEARPDLTLRAGYSYNDQPIPALSAQQNFIAPGVVQHHITGGGKLKWNDSMDLEMAAMFAPDQKVKGPAQFPGGFPAGEASIHMYQWEATAGVVWHLGDTEAPLK
jgi:long-chain fatty acid transport protein